MSDSKKFGDDFPRFSVTSPGRTKAGRLRDLFNEIAVAQQAGWRLDAIVRGLEEQELSVSIDVLKTSLKRIRAQRRKADEIATLAPQRESVQAATVNAEKPDLNFSPEGFRDPAPRFVRDIHRRINLDEE